MPSRRMHDDMGGLLDSVTGLEDSRPALNEDAANLSRETAASNIVALSNQQHLVTMRNNFTCSW